MYNDLGGSRRYLDSLLVGQIQVGPRQKLHKTIINVMATTVGQAREDPTKVEWMKKVSLVSSS